MIRARSEPGSEPGRQVAKYGSDGTVTSTTTITRDRSHTDTGATPTRDENRTGTGTIPISFSININNITVGNIGVDLQLRIEQLIGMLDRLCEKSSSLFLTALRRSLPATVSFMDSTAL